MSNAQENLGYLLSKATKLIKMDFGLKLKEYSLTVAQWSVIKDVSMSTARVEQGADIQLLTPAAVAERLYLDRPTISGIVQRLIVGGWLERHENPSDRRSQIVRLTKKSQKVVEELSSLSDETMQAAVAGLSLEEIATLKSQLRRIIDNLS